MPRRADHNSAQLDSDGRILTSDQMRLLTAIRRIAHAADSHSKKVERELGITVPQLVVLAAIRRLGEVTTGTLADAASLSQATVTTILDKLEAKALITRYRSRLDRRVVHSRLTERAETLLEGAPPLLNDAFVRRFEALASRRKAAVVAALEQVAELMDAPSDQVAGPAMEALASLLREPAPAEGAHGAMARSEARPEPGSLLRAGQR